MKKHQLYKKVSIVIPVYNEVNNIKQMVRILAQSFKGTNLAYEIIYIDDHSTDGTYEEIKRLKNRQVKVYRKEGIKGKAFSLIEGFNKSTGEILAMIDGDLQYPPEAIPQMAQALSEYDVVASSRKHYHSSLLRRFISRSFKFAFGQLLFGLNHDIQSGLKVFKKEVWESVKFSPVSPWTFDLEFLYRAAQSGFSITDYEIDLSKRMYGESKVSSLKTSIEIGLNALLLKLKKVGPQKIVSLEKNSMIGSGIGYRKKKYITHTTMDYKKSALITFTLSQKLVIFSLLLLLTIAIFLTPFTTFKGIISVLSILYFIDTLFTFFLVLKSLSMPQEFSFTPKLLNRLQDSSLPMYSILCPLYKEAHIIPQFVKAISALEWPKEKIDVMLLLEEDDKASISAVKKMSLPPFVRVVVVPDSQPKTKPKACNYGLSLAKGDYLVIYDAEDIPDPLQLKKAYFAFQKSPSDVICLQAKLNYYNSDQNLLTRFFTAEYSLWFDVMLTGLQSLETSLPLGGTSNHFKTKFLRAVEGWDPFNVTEDADLGVRLFKAGYKTAVIDSVTLEEANSKVKNWLRQRSRWIKGYMQTYLVHMRDFLTFGKEKNIHFLYFQLTIGVKIGFILINPLLWIATIMYVALYPVVGPTIEALYSGPVLYFAVISLIFGNFLFLYYYMIGCAKHGHWSLIKYVYLIPLYWFMLSTAAAIALYQLIIKPHYWEKTLHGLHLKQPEPVVVEEIPAPEKKRSWKIPVPTIPAVPFPSLNLAFSKRFTYVPATSLIISSIIGGIVSIMFNSYMGRSLSASDFGLISLISGFSFIAAVPLNALTSTINYRSGFIDTKYGKEATYAFWQYIRKYSFYFSAIVWALWVIASPFMKDYFQTKSILPFLMFAPIWIFGLPAAVDKGVLLGRLLFGGVALVLLIDPLMRIASSYLLITSHVSAYAYSSITIGFLIAFVLGWMLVKNGNRHLAKPNFQFNISYFPIKFFMAALLTGISTMTFMAVDVVLAKHYLSPLEAGEYALISSIGKIIFFLGGLSTQFLIPLVSRNNGANKDSRRTLHLILFSTFLASWIGFVLFGLLGDITVPLILGKNAIDILPYLPSFTFGVMSFTIAGVFVSFYLVKKIYLFPFAALLISIFQVTSMLSHHESINSFVSIMTLTGGINLVVMLLMHFNLRIVSIVQANISDFFNLFTPQPKITLQTNNKLNILIFNWRDINHAWAGGAEVYIHEVAKRWVKEGNTVTMFTGSDLRTDKNQVIDGINIIRRGGFYTVYLWAFLYYVLHFRGKYDVIIDCENGVPFFTPLYTHKPIFLLVHHIHQDVFFKHLPFPLSLIAYLAECKLMPLVYKNKNVITVSESSRDAIQHIGLTPRGNIEIIHPGIDADAFTSKRKHPTPVFTYLGRLKPYKNVDVAIHAMKKILRSFPDAQLLILGDGEHKSRLMALTAQLKLQDSVVFMGKVSNEEKTEILARSWFMLQPSSIEGWGITVIEANACGTPVIASRVSGLKDSVLERKTGLLVAPGNVDDLADAINFLLVHTSYRKKLTLHAKEWAKKFNWDKSASIFYQTIIQGMRSEALNQATAQGIFVGGKTV